MTRFRVLAAVILLGMVLCSAATAQTDAADSAAAQAIDLKFQGGTAAEYIEAIRRVATNLNIVVMPEVAQVRMQPVELNRVDPTAAVRLLHGLRQERPEGTIVLSVDTIPGELFRSTVYTVSAIPEGRGRQRKATASAVWTLTEILEGGTAAEDVLTAVETALEMFDEDYDQATLRFHEETGLLMAYARPEQVEAANDVIEALSDALRSGKPAERATEVAGLRSALDKARGEVQALHNELVESETRLKLYMMEIESLRQERKEMGQEMRRAIAERDSIINSLEIKLRMLEMEHQESSGGDG